MNAVAERKAHLDNVRTTLEAMKPQLAAALPKHITPDRMLRVAMAAVQNTPKLLECDRASLYSAIMKSTQLGLEPDGILGQAYLIPFGGQVQFIVGYKGLIDLARRSGEVSNIIAKEVYENDEFAVDWSQDIPFIHKPHLGDDRGEVTHFWALARFKDGGFHWDYMTYHEVMQIRDGSQGWQSAVKFNKTASSPWQKHFIEMGKKTVIRRIAKFLPMSVQKAAAFDAMQEAGKKVEIDDYGDITIDGTAEDVTDREGGQSTKLDGFAGGHDPETGEVIENAPQGFVINEEDLTTQASTKKVSAELQAYLKKLPQEERSAAFLAAGGAAFSRAVSDHGLGMDKAKFADLGISL